MRASTSSLLRLKPIPVSKVNLHQLRLPASQRPPQKVAPTSDSTGSTDGTFSPAVQPPSLLQAHKQGEHTIAELLLRKKRQLDAAGEETTTSTWPNNLRVIKHVHSRDLYWKVPAESRTQLKKLLREE